jgi:hypothetical protein
VERDGLPDVLPNMTLGQLNFTPVSLEESSPPNFERVGVQSIYVFFGYLIYLLYASWWDPGRQAASVVIHASLHHISSKLTRNFEFFVLIRFTLQTVLF